MILAVGLRADFSRYVEMSYQSLEEISRQLNGWLRSSRVVLTCRLNVWQADVNTLETFETYRLLDFDYPQQVHEFIDNWFGKESEKRELTKIILLKVQN
ncbi:MAG: hypothetical protein RMY16_27375 [Nostoc sp. DedQUE12b]|uniref:hypothetical protein n=1 Tax=Nostoc sp. DedQUE12b TaxID=3075398 RepID=UPI002AD40BB9|nr:hypothetical protein [Nostoc sp. DedQUE12b]MDZ8089243.1 hypothetical protein [Nostoc sp. DedQUE12b]